MSHEYHQNFINSSHIRLFRKKSIRSIRMLFIHKVLIKTISDLRSIMNTGIPINFYELLRVTVISGEVLLSPENIFRV